jgi:predicted nucleotide-binding protein
VATRNKNTVSEQKLPTELLISQDDAKSKLQDRIQKGLELKQIHVNSLDTLNTAKNEYYKWNSFNTELLKRIFTTEEHSNEYSYCFYAGFGVFIGRDEPSIDEKRNDLYKDIDEKNYRLDSIIERLELIPVNKMASLPISNTDELTRSHTKTKKVFVVHGHDEIAKASLEIFLRDIGLEPIVLHRQADEGLTIIEKFEKHSDVGYAFILLTPDEISYVKAEESKEDSARKKEFRARPNVIFEFGYFVGKLGRSRVCCLSTGDVSLPSDVSGVIYKRFTNSIEEVAYSIMKDLKASGYEIDR